MKQLVIAERVGLIGHIVSMVFGLVGILIVVPNAEVIFHFSEIGQTAMQWSMAGGGVVYMILGTAAVFLYGLRTLGLGRILAFMLPAILISLTSELLGTSTGFPFGHYSYLSGLGYKISGLVPFTIPLSWFYLGCVSYLLARAGLEVDTKPGWWRHIVAIALGSLLLTSWDFVLDPAMSQTSLPFWYWHQPGAFFGMPYQNFAGWWGTGAVFMTVSALLWKNNPIKFERSQLNLPLVVYLANFGFATVMSLAAGFSIPVVLGCFLGVAPALALWLKGSAVSNQTDTQSTTNQISVANIEVALK
ncbi:carotenoid biosynthesis protein [Anabaenopsis tanganyikae CS-531]|uniref:Carotenoid biosynthesis protein n=2 Tax=Anabaenopsis TaxID=110103 RepID=A0ABT5ANL3_9CYAN|nr:MULTISPECIES: carotenoid biosynthesis protein [Anabaenopsis]MDB9538905.1 carotenoid biosynthesis protein [Anabaenopsis arnoldii]MDH6091193.1 carotenoid biosynthesis protein [Anabaenopsis arnoldii]MDH6104767.1 carotenoid biosynthesis protein [Anabaenopsis tanganyikae CS-531]